MIELSLDKVHGYVLQVLDEIRNIEDDAMLAETEDLDAIDTRKMAEGFFVEAVLKAHKDAPSYLVDGVKGTEQPRPSEEATPKEGENPEEEETQYDYSVSFDGTTAQIVMLKESARLASIKASDSDIVVVDYAPEDSPIGRMQNNAYVKGTYDDPRLIVKKAWAEVRKPEYLYYSVKGNTATFVLEYVPYPVLQDGKLSVSDKLEYAVLNLLASMVLEALGLIDKANIYKAKYVEYLQSAR